MTRRRSVLRERDVLLLVVASTVSVVGDAAALVALVLRMHAGGDGGWAIAALLLAGSAPMIVLSPLAGSVVDRIDSRTAIAGSALAQAGCAWGLAHVHDVAPTLALVALLAGSGTLVGPAVGALLPRTVPADRLVDASAVMQSAFVLGNLAGPPIGGLLTGAWGSSAPLELDAVSFLAIAVGIFFVRTRRRPARAERSRSRARSGLRLLWNDPVLRAVVSAMTLLMLAAGAVNVAEVFLVKDALRGSDAVFGIVGASWMAGMIVGSAATPRLGREPGRLLRVMAAADVVLALGLVTAGIAPTWPLAATAFVVGGAGNGAMSVACRTIVTLLVPDEFRGRVTGLMTGSMNAAGVLAFGAGGLLVSLLGPRWTIVGCGVAALVVAFVFSVQVRAFPTTATDEAVVSAVATA